MNSAYRRFLLAGAGIFLGYQGIKLAGRQAINRIADASVKTIMTDLYDENIWELISAANRIGYQEVVEINMRAEEGKLINRPMGSPKKFPSLDALMFNAAQFHPMPTPLEVPVDTSVIIGKRAKRPFKISLPMMITAMAYGEALSAKAKWALAKGASMAKTAICSGEGPYLQEERDAADTYIYFYNRGDWNKDEKRLRDCSGIEIQFGQGAFGGGVGHVVHAKEIDRRLRHDFHFPKGKDAVTQSRQPEVPNIEELPKLVRRLQEKSDGVPVGAKIAAGKWLEKDLAVLCHAGVDYIVVDGAEAATKGSPPILQDDFGVPTVYAVTRAANWLAKNNFQDQVSLIASGKIRKPGDVLKAVALGADATYIGAAALFAMAHDQVLKALPFEPPTQVAWYTGKYEGGLNKKKAARTLAKFFLSCKAELEAGIKSLGKTSLGEVNRSDLFSLDEAIARGTGLPMAYETGDDPSAAEPGHDLVTH